MYKIKWNRSNKTFLKQFLTGRVHLNDKNLMLVQTRNGIESYKYKCSIV